ncbi:MAG TPA: hypothetical protein PKA77_17835 [Chitinophagaceae bacterium]|nr:hypothetical protein [Chitinophagaceae bacterium]
MGRAKEIIVKVIPSKIANDFVKLHHYSKKVVANSQLHFGAFLDGRLHGVMSYGCSLDKRKMLGLVEGTGWNEFLELNRMAFDDYLPNNSESRCIGISIKLIKKNAPHIKWIVSFADGTQCGDGAIYRASGFFLTSVKENKSILEIGSEVFTNIGIRTGKAQRNKFCKATFCQGRFINDTGKASDKKFIDAGANYIPGFQFRYIYLIDKTAKINVPILPFSKIDEMGAGMYKGKKITIAERQKCDVSRTANAAGFQLAEGGQHDHIAQNTENKQLIEG